MYDAPGIGLAAIQVGVAKRVVVIDLAKKDEPQEPQVFINPEIPGASDENVDLRGRLPVDPGILRGGRAAGAGEGQISRPRRQGAARSRPSGLLATCLQHEIDHLNGVLFIDHISKLKRDRVIKKFTKAAKRARVRRTWRPDCRCASSSWARRTSPCRRSRDRRRAAMRSRRSIPARRKPGRPRHGAAADARSSARRDGFGLPVFTPARRCGRRSAQAAVARAWRRRRRGRRLWPDPAEADPRGVPARLPSTCMPRCCRAGAARRRSSAPSWPATPRPASW